MNFPIMYLGLPLALGKLKQSLWGTDLYTGETIVDGRGGSYPMEVEFY